VSTPLSQEKTKRVIRIAAGAVLTLGGVASLLLGLLLVIAAMGAAAGYVAGAIFAALGIALMAAGIVVFRRGLALGQSPRASIR